MRASRFSSVLIQALRGDANAKAQVLQTIKGVSGQTADLVQVQDSDGAILHRVGPTQVSPFGLGGSLRMGRAKYSFAVDGGGAPGLITPATNCVIPDNAIIIGGIANPTTALVGSSTTIAIGTSAGSAANSLKTATAEATYSTDAVLALVPVFTAATAVKMTAAGSITITTAVAALTAGVMEITVFYFVAAA
jgi:hypothetical protein